MNVVAETFVGLFDDPDRDERGNVSAAYRCRPIGDAAPTPREEAAQVGLFDPDELPRLGFDHEQIVAGAVETNSQT